MEMEFDNRLLHTLNETERITIQIRLNEVCKLIGVQEVQDETLMSMMVKLIPEYYPSLTLKEVTFAFVDNVAGKLVEKPIEMFYNSFDWTYVAKVLTAYTKSKQAKKLEVPRQPLGRNFQLEAASDESMWRAEYVSMLRWIRNDGGIIPPMGNFWQCFQYLKLKGRINPTKDEYNEMINESFAYVNQEADKLQHPQQRADHRKFYAKDGIAFKNLCRERYFRQWLQNEFMNAGESDNATIEWLDNELRNIDRAVAA